MTSPETLTYQYLSPSEVVAGQGASKRAGDLLSRWGVGPGQRVGLVVDADVKALGLSDPVQEALQATGFTVEPISCDRGEPRLDGVQRVIAELRHFNPAACVGIGGGSAMDIAKLAAALVRNDGDVSEYLGLGKVQKDSVPTVMIPTTAGTGSETTQVSMLSTEGRKVAVASAPLMPRGAILDPALTVKLPPNVTAASGLDALSHALESYLSLRANPLTMGASVTGARLVASSLSGVVDTPEDLDGRMNMLGGAYWSGLGLNASVVIGHSIAYTIANRTGLAHGVSCAMALPYCLAYNERAVHSRIERVAAALREQIGEESGGPADPTGIYGWLSRMAKDLDIPFTLKDVGIERDDIEGMVIECIESYPRANNHVPFDRDDIGKLYDFMYAGDVPGCLEEFRSN